jgi:DNA-binding PucR family transcriptional regulator
MHPNTVYKKVRRIEQLLEVSVAERRVELTNALMLAQSLGDQVLRSG